MAKARKSVTFKVALDDGLAAYVRAHAAWGLYGGEAETIVALIRNSVTRNMESEGLRRCIVPHLPRRYRKHWPEAKS